MVKFSLFLFLISTLFFVVFKPAEAMVQTERALLLQQVEILQQEARLLRSLLLNMQRRGEVSAVSYLAMNLSDNSIILSKNENQSHSIASITKLMTAVIALENIEKNQKIVLTREMLKPFGRSPSLFPGLNVSAENLIKASIIQSSNDASKALAHFLGEERFLSLMSQKAEKLGMVNTSFSDTSGLNPANRSTVSDLAKLISYIYKEHPQIFEISKDNNFWLPDSAGRLLKFRNLNNFYHLPEFIGGKTGFLPQARQTFASAFRVNEEPIAIILLRSDNVQSDIFTILNQLRRRVALSRANCFGVNVFGQGNFSP